MSEPKEFWILDNPETPYPTCYRGEPTWGCEPDDTGRVVHVVERTPLIAAAPELLDALKRIFKLIDEGKIGRDTSRDHDPLWVLQAMDVVVGLRLGHDAITKAEGSDAEQEEAWEHG